MPTIAYPACIRRLYESEVNGEAIYSALLAVSASERDRYHFATLLQLESETKAWLLPFLFRHRVALTRPDIRSLVEGAVGLYREKGWKALMSAAQQVVGNALRDFEAIAKVGPADDAEYLVGMIEHEEAIQGWVEGELAEIGDASLNGVISKLRHPIPRSWA